MYFIKISGQWCCVEQIGVNRAQGGGRKFMRDLARGSRGERNPQVTATVVYLGVPCGEGRGLRKARLMGLSEVWPTTSVCVRCSFQQEEHQLSHALEESPRSK